MQRVRLHTTVCYVGEDALRNSSAPQLLAILSHCPHSSTRHTCNAYNRYMTVCYSSTLAIFSRCVLVLQSVTYPTHPPAHDSLLQLNSSNFSPTVSSFFSPSHIQRIHLHTTVCYSSTLAIFSHCVLVLQSVKHPMHPPAPRTRQLIFSYIVCSLRDCMRMSAV